MKNNVLKIHPDDSVLVALTDLEPGDLARWDGLTVTEAVPAKHKLAIQDFSPGDHIMMYGTTLPSGNGAFLSKE